MDCVVTGLGVVSPNGIGKDRFWAGVRAGESGIGKISLFDATAYRCRHAGEVMNFTPAEYLGSKGLRNLDRTTLLALVAAKMALDDAGLTAGSADLSGIGVVLGSTMGSVHSISEFDKEGLREGPRYVNPAQFPNTVINSPASQVAIRFGLRGLNATISTGFTAGLDALGYALDMLRLGRASALLVGGVEELCLQTFLGFYKLGLLATSNNGTAPRLGNGGTLLGEGAAFFMLETLDAAQARRATIYARVLGHASQFHPDSMYKVDPEAKSAVSALTQMLDGTGVKATEVQHLFTGANGTKICDQMEQTAINRVFGNAAPPHTAVKALIGESFSAGGALQIAGALGMLQQGVSRVAVTSVGPMGNSSAVLLERSA